MIATLGLAISRFVRRFAPDPFALAVLLTILVLGLALGTSDRGFGELVDAWAGRGGIWALHAFGMQMCLILVTGHALASSPPIQKLLYHLASTARGAVSAVALVASVSCVLGVLNWGLGLIGGALFARLVGSRMHDRGTTVHYPLLAAAGYTALLVWHGGFSGSAPLKMTQPSDIAEVFGAASTLQPLPLTETILAPANLVITGGLLILVPILFALLHPRRAEDCQTIASMGLDQSPELHEAEDLPTGWSLPRWLEQSPWLSVALVSLFLVWAWRFYFPAEGPSGITRLSPDSVNATLLLLGLALHGTPQRYLRAVRASVPGVAGIILLFPLYAGIMGLMRFSGLTEVMAGFLATSGDAALRLSVFASAALVNLFVPSGGGQWAIQGPVAMQAAQAAGLDPASIVMAVAYGDQLTNMLQPFWALPLLAITGVKARDIVGYTALVMLVAALWIMAGLLLF